jgi:fido (protein-threonine AMPylation protein)
MGRDGTAKSRGSFPRSRSSSHPVLGSGEVFLAREVPASSLSRAEKEGAVRRLARGIYTTNTTDSPEQVTRRNLWRIIGMLFRGAVIGDRSVCNPGRPSGDGSVYLISPDVSERGRNLELPGLTLRLRHGMGAVTYDAPLPGEIWLSSTARGLLENARLTRSRGDRLSRTLSRAELEEWLESLLDERGETRFLELRDQAREIAPALGLQAELETVDALFGAVLGTRNVRAESPLLRARQQGLPYDDRRVELFKALHEELSSLAPRSRISPPDAPRVRYLPFFDAYFSNYIEGTEFTIEEAKEIVFDRIVPPARPADAHDVLGTYALVADIAEMRRLPGSFDEYLELLRNRHWRMMEQRPEVHPGEFKTQANRAGVTMFVDPARVKGTLAQGFALHETLNDPFARAVFQMFLVAEVHPFTDGNGRIARIMTNAELLAAGEERLLIPPAYRSDYIGSLRALSGNGFADRLPRVLDFAQRYTRAIDFSDFDQAVEQLSSTNAFVDSDDAERDGIRLRMPASAGSVA